MKVFAIIVGAGKGKRFGGLKQFVKFQGRPLLIYTTENFVKNKFVVGVIIVVPKNMVKKTQKLIKDFGLKKVYKIIPGGKRRQDSVFNGVAALKNETGVVLIHDAVRPFVSQKLISRGIKLCAKYRAVIFGRPVFDSLKHVKGKKVIGTIPRISPIYAIQTPQFFDIQYLRKAYSKIDFKTEFTDEASILESVGMDVFIFKGEPNNIKITTKEDLEIIKKRL